MSQWFYSNDGGTQFGPVSLAELQQLIQSGALNSSSLVWKEGQPQWVYASTVEELFPKYGGAPASVPQYAAPVAYPPSAVPASYSSRGAEVVSFWEWVGLMLLFYIPFVNFICLIIFACGVGNPNLTNFSRAALAWIAVIFVLALLFYAAAASA